MIPYQVLHPFVPEKWCLELDPFLLGLQIFRGELWKVSPFLAQLSEVHQSQLPVVEHQIRCDLVLTGCQKVIFAF